MKADIQHKKTAKCISSGFNGILMTLIISLLCLDVILASSDDVWGLSVNKPVEKISGISISPSEFSQLPEFLKVKVKYHHSDHSNPRYRKWAKIIGVDYQHLHHFAAALVKYNRAMCIRDKVKRDFAFGGVVGEYNYLLRHCTPDFKLRYLFHFNKGRALFFKGEIAKAIIEFRSSIRLNAGFKPAYAMLAQAYKSVGMEKEAQEIIKKASEIVKSKVKMKKK